MRVVAKQTGFCNGHRRRAGAEFDVPDGFVFPKNCWFVPFSEYKAPAPPPKDEPATLSELGRKKPRSPIENLSDEI